LPLPGYMAASSSQIRWIGIDPFFGDAARHFPFAQALGEYLPFRAGVFDGVLYASTIYHQMDPERSLERTRSVIKPDGRLYIWYEPQRIDGRYIIWRTRQALGWLCSYSRSHRWAFTRKSLRSLLVRAGWAVEEEVLLCVRCPEYATCRDPAAFLVIARRR
jgi:SAM-dependent methyltransferase